MLNPNGLLIMIFIISMALWIGNIYYGVCSKFMLYHIAYISNYLQPISFRVNDSGILKTTPHQVV